MEFMVHRAHQPLLINPGQELPVQAVQTLQAISFFLEVLGYANSNMGSLNDLWEYDPLNNQWTWIKGDSTVDNNGVYGVKGIAASSNKPGGRFGNTFWADNTGSIFLFGGTGYAAIGWPEYLNDFWKISIN